METLERAGLTLQEIDEAYEYQPNIRQLPHQPGGQIRQKYGEDDIDDDYEQHSTYGEPESSRLSATTRASEKEPQLTTPKGCGKA
eukprot:5892767-Amphidinium_carterae.2